MRLSGICTTRREEFLIECITRCTETMCTLLAYLMNVRFYLKTRFANGSLRFRVEPQIIELREYNIIRSHFVIAAAVTQFIRFEINLSVLNLSRTS